MLLARGRLGELVGRGPVGELSACDAKLLHNSGQVMRTTKLVRAMAEQYHWGNIHYMHQNCWESN